MLLTPRYGDKPIVSVEVREGGPHPILQQRARFAEVLHSLTDDEWRHPSRCDGWTVQDVITHLTSANHFWAISIQSGAAGQPTQFLAAFDPVASPQQMVAQEQGTPVAATLEAFETSCDALAAAVDDLSPEDWEALAEAPTGHVPIRLVADHALWDSWVHERDVVLPLGRTPVVEEDEVLAALRYCAALGRAFEVTAGQAEPSAVLIEATDPATWFVVEVRDGTVRVHNGPVPAGSPSCSASAAALIDMLSLRDAGVPVPEPVRQLTAGLATVFDQPSGGAA